MILIPAIDLLDGRCVRLMHGKFEEVTYYDRAPEAIAKTYHQDGAEWLHVVDLAASRDGEGADTASLFKLLLSTDQKVQTGGGVRSGGDIKARLDGGAARVIVGSLSAQEPERFLGWVEQFGAEAIVAALDVSIDNAGVPRPRIFGWTQEAGMDLWTLLDQLMAGGLRHALVTDIGRDGAMSGPNVELYEEIISRYPELQLQASGGVSRVEDLTTLRAAGAAGAIVGKALLEKAFTVAHALEKLQ